VQRELDRIIASRVFRGSHRCQTFLQYVVTQTLQGASKLLKERTLAVHVFGREATGDLSDDSIVRVGAREVRKRLAQYYIGEGANNPVRIELPAGCYIPTFHHHLPGPVAEVDTDPGLAPATTLPPHAGVRRFQHDRKVWIAGAIVLAAVLAAALEPIYTPRSSFDSFWQPAFEEKRPLIIAIASPIVYHPSWRADRLDIERNGFLNPPVQRPINLPADALNGSDFVPALNQYVGFGDAEAALQISFLLTEHHGRSRVRLASKIEFNDLRDTGTVLIGAYTNRWTMDLTKNMRYRFGYYPDGKPCIEKANVGCQWTLTTKADDGRSAEDYILLCRLPHSPTNGFTVVCAGLNVYGTEEAGRIVSDPESLTPILRAMPKSWWNHNLQIVLHVAVIGDAPAQSELVSVYSW
jgi:hypothetical protein